MHIYYNSNGFAHHRLSDVVDVLADLGYDGLALTPDVQHLDPWRADTGEVERLRRHVERRGLGITIESGARFLLDRNRKHQPTLLSKVGFERRQEFIVRLIDLAAELGSPLVSIWSGRPEKDTPGGAAGLDLLAERLMPLLEHARLRTVSLCFEPEPGMLVETIAEYHRLCLRLAHQDLWLTIDTGHLAARERAPFHEHLMANRAQLKNVHLDDALSGIHEHLPLGSGVLDFQALWATLSRMRFEGPVAVELSRHSHVAPEIAEQTIKFLRDLGRNHAAGAGRLKDRQSQEMETRETRPGAG